MIRDSKERSIMSMEIKRPGDVHRAPEDNYEKSDADVSGVLKSGFWLFVLLVVVFVSMRGTFNKMSEMEPMGKAASPLQTVREMPPAPRLQTEPQTELHDYCEGQVKSLSSYAWRDSHAGIVQIPVDRAIDLTVEHSLPARAAGNVSEGVSPQVQATPPAADTTGQCGYLTEHDAEKEAAAKEAGEEGKK
jgi:hypothetical protein